MRRLSFGVLIAVMASFLMMGCDTVELEKQIAQLQEDLKVTNEEAGERKNQVIKLQEDLKVANKEAEKRKKQLPALVKAEALKRSCVADARFNVRHDGQRGFRDAVKAGMNSRQAQSISQGSSHDRYQAEDITEDEFDMIVKMIKDLANIHVLPLASLDEFPGCETRQAKSEHMPGLGEAKDLCDAVLTRIINLQVPSGTTYWLYDPEKGIQAANTELVKQVPVGCQPQDQGRSIVVYAMLVRELASEDFENEKLRVVFYRKIEVPAKNGEIGKGITSSTIPEAARRAFAGELN